MNSSPAVSVIPQPVSIPDDLRIQDMRVVWRDTFIIDRPQEKQHGGTEFLVASKARLEKLAVYVGDGEDRRRDQPDPLRVIQRASRNVARMGYDSLARFQFAPFRLTNLRPTLARLRTSPENLTHDEIESAAREAHQFGQWLDITPMLVLHRAGVGIMEYLVSMTAPEPGYTVDEAIEIVRLGISPQLLGVSDAWKNLFPQALTEWGITQLVTTSPNWNLAIMGLRDVSQLIASEITPHKGPAVRAARPTGSATVVLVETTPQAGEDIQAFVNQYAAPLRGIGAMDNYYSERAEWVVSREVNDNFSVDSEAGVYLLGTSELIVFNDHLRPIVEQSRRRLGLPNEDLVVTYLYMHYEVLMEWIYLQEAILRAYIQKLDALVKLGSPHRSRMIATLQGALADLVQYQENISPYATRIEFLERAGVYHKLDELADRFERKQEMLLNYASEYHDYREARGTDYLNILAGILTGASLANLITTLAGITAAEPAIYLGINAGCVVLVVGILLFVQRRM